MEVLNFIKNDFLLEIIGGGYYAENVKRKVRRSKFRNRIRYIEWIEGQRELKKKIKESLLVVLPSIWGDPCPLVGIETMEFGKPVVAFNVGGISDYLKNGKNGFLIKPYNQVEYARKIDYFLENPRMAKKMGEWGRAFVRENYNIEKHVKILFDVIENS